MTPTTTANDEMTPFFDLLTRESDRACAVLGGEFLSARLEELLRAAMAVAPSRDESKSLFSSFGPLANFGARIDIAYHFGFIADDERHDLRLIKRIRNGFAHDVQTDMANGGLSFSNAEIAKRCLDLSLPKILYESTVLSVSHDGARRRFEMCVGILLWSLSGQRLAEASPRKRPVGATSVVAAYMKRTTER